MTKAASPRWTHKCPNCQRKIFWERIYCGDCIKLDPRRIRFRLSRNQRWLSNLRMSGISKTNNHLFISTLQCTICAECGRKLNGHDLKHKCFSRSDASLRLRNNLKCSLCKLLKPKTQYTVVRQGGILVRTRICIDCLDGSKLVIVAKRKYERRKVL